MARWYDDSVEGLCGSRISRPPDERSEGCRQEVSVMPTFVLMTKLAPDDLQDPKARKAMGKEWLHKVKATCPDVKWIAHYALLGRYEPSPP